jgi:type 2 lantibiotic biosynthesis protein LanM
VRFGVAVLSDRELAEIVEQASTISERLGVDFAPLETANRCQLVSNRITSWCEAIGDGDQDVLLRRLTWDGLDWSMVRRALGPVRLSAGSPKPRWSVILQRIGTVGAKDVSDVLAVEGLPAFERILAPFALTAWDVLATRLDSVAELVSKEAYNQLLQSLLHELAVLSSRALHFESAVYCAYERSSWGRLTASGGEVNKEQLSDQFVQFMADGGLATFLKQYPVLARFLATITTLWVDATDLLLQRLAADLPDIEKFLDAKGMLRNVTGLQSSLSDPHFGRRTVSLVTFASGHKVIYKPKNMDMELAYNQLLDWLNRHGLALSLKVGKVLERSGYGWVHFTAHRPCRTKEEIRRYYERAGMMLCLVYVLEGTDCHCENIIASGEHPVLIDTETLCHPRLLPTHWDRATDAGSLANDRLSQSVLRTGLLPAWEVHGESRPIAYEISGLGGNHFDEHSVEAPHLKSPPTAVVSDRMHASSLARSNLPTRACAPPRLTDFVEDLVTGFRRMYGFLITHREALGNEYSPLNRLAGQHVRFLYRPTRIYNAILHHVLDPRYLRDGVDWSIQLEILARPFTASDELQGRSVPGERPHLWPMLLAEKEAIQQGDIPHFAASTDSNLLELATDDQVHGCFREASFQTVMRNLTSLNDEDLQQQSDFIRDALGTYCARHRSVRLPDREAGTEGSVRWQGSSTAASLIAGALNIAEEVSARAIRGADRSATWITPQYLDPIDRYRLEPADESLFGGRTGIALFLAAVEKVTGGSGYRELALDALRSLREQVQTSGERLATRIGIGGCSGLGSVIYAMVRIHCLLREPLLEDAQRAASLITADRIKSDRFLDVANGTAGAILGLLALYEASSDELSLERAVCCGQHLLAQRTRTGTGHRTWATSEGKGPTGMAHGAAGVAYSLARLHRITGLDHFMEAATESMGYEASGFSPEAGNWPDLKSHDQVASITSWCHGILGIGLAQLGGPMPESRFKRQRDIDVVFKAAEKLALTPVDHLCCGNMGRAELLLVGGRQLSCPKLADAATSIASHVLERSEEIGSFGLNPLLPDRLFNPGFLQGTTGIGYGLLRIVHPLPSVLHWE